MCLQLLQECLMQNNKVKDGIDMCRLFLLRRFYEGIPEYRIKFQKFENKGKVTA